MMNYQEFFMYAMETEGDLPTRRGKIQKVIKLLAECEDPDDADTQERVFTAAGIDFALTDKEQRYVAQEVRKKWR